MQRAKGIDPRRMWIPEEVGCHLQIGVPLCKSGTAQGTRASGMQSWGTISRTSAKEDQNRNKFARTWKGYMLGRRQLMLQEGTSRTRNRDFKEQLYLGSEWTTTGIYRKTIRLEIVKRVVGIFSRLQKIRTWTLWWGWIPRKQKKLVAILAMQGACGSVVGSGTMLQARRSRVQVLMMSLDFFQLT
jgi:hypothetical protein